MKHGLICVKSVFNPWPKMLMKKRGRKLKYKTDAARRAAGGLAVKNWRERKRAEGLCPRCGDEGRGYNPRTGKPFKLGPRCRAKEAASQKLLMRRRRKAER